MALSSASNYSAAYRVAIASRTQAVSSASEIGRAPKISIISLQSRPIFYKMPDRSNELFLHRDGVV